VLLLLLHDHRLWRLRHHMLRRGGWTISHRRFVIAIRLDLRRSGRLVWDHLRWGLILVVSALLPAEVSAQSCIPISRGSSRLFNVIRWEETGPVERVCLALRDDSAAIPLLVD
jgi:hypothetical protein